MLVGGAVVAWCFTIDDQVGDADVAGVLIAGAVILTSGFATVKMILSGNAPLHKAAAIPLIVSALVNGLGVFIAPGSETALPAYVFAVRFLPSLLIAVGARIQEVVARFDENAFGARNTKPYSLLPYGSIAVAFTTMIEPASR